MAGPCIHGVGGCAWGVVNTDLLPRHLPFLPSGRGDESLKPPPAVHGAGFFIEVASSKGFELLAQIHPGQNRTPGELPLFAMILDACCSKGKNDFERGRMPSQFASTQLIFRFQSCFDF
jgi:hypothetical protein